MFKKALYVILIGFVVLIAAAAGSIVNTNAKSSEECSPRGNSEIKCVWVQQRTTGQCMWKPENSLHNAWDPIPEGSCPQILATPTPTSYIGIITLTPTGVIPVTGITPTPTSLPSEVIETPISLVGEAPLGVPVTGGEKCDICLEERRQADALEQIADSLATIAAESVKP